MKRLISITFLATFTAVAGQALADDITVESQPFTSTATRAQVHTDLAQYKTQPNPWSIAHDPLVGFKSSLSREEVRSEYIASRVTVAAFAGEDSGSFALAQGQQGESYLASSAATGNRAN